MFSYSTIETARIRDFSSKKWVMGKKVLNYQSEGDTANRLDMVKLHILEQNQKSWKILHWLAAKDKSLKTKYTMKKSGCIPTLYFLLQGIRDDQ
jgi:hypothetical protein